MTTPLTENEIIQGLENHLNWTYKNNKITRSVTFKDHLEAMSFLNAIAFYAEKACHHPDVQFCYNKVQLNYQTHDAGNKVTKKDLQAAHHIEKLLEGTP